MRGIMDDQRTLFEQASKSDLDDEAAISIVRKHFPSTVNYSKASKTDSVEVAQTSVDRGPRLDASDLFDGCRVVPNVIARSGLFGVVGRGRGEAERNITIETFGKDAPPMSFTGERLNQFDLDVWTSIVDMQLREGGDPVLFSGYAMLRKLGRGTSKRDYTSLESSLRRLSEGVAHFEYHGMSHVGRFIVDLDKTDSGYEVWLNSVMQSLFEYQGEITYLREDVRAQLKGGLSKWLHAFISTHRASPLKMKVENVRDWCGSSTSQLYRFRQMLRRSLDELVELEIVSRYGISKRDIVCLYA